MRKLHTGLVTKKVSLFSFQKENKIREKVDLDRKKVRLTTSEGEEERCERTKK